MVVIFFFQYCFYSFFVFVFLWFCVAVQQPNFIKRLKYTLDYIERGEFTVLQDVIKITTLETLNKGQRNVDSGGV